MVLTKLGYEGEGRRELEIDLGSGEKLGQAIGQAERANRDTGCRGNK